MSLKDSLTEHANVIRSKTGVSDSLSIHDMTRLLGDLKWGKENLLKGTSDQYRDLSLQGWGQISTSTNGTNPIDISSYPDGTNFTYSATVSNPANNDIQLEISTYGPKPYNRLFYLDTHSSICTRGQENTILSTTITKKEGIGGITTWIIGLKEDGNGTPIKIKDERLYIGTEPGIWTPSPYDLDGQIIINPNLATGTDDYSGKLWGSYSPNNVTDKFMGLTVKEVYGGGHIGPIVTVPDGDYTYSFFVKHNVDNGNSFNAKARPFDLDTMQEDIKGDTVISGSLNGTDWQRVSFTFKNLKAGSYLFMAENWPGNWHDTVWVAGQKVESGDMLTGYLTKDNHLIDSSDLKGGGN